MNGEHEVALPLVATNHLTAKGGILRHANGLFLIHIFLEKRGFQYSNHAPRSFHLHGGRAWMVPSRGFKPHSIHHFRRPIDQPQPVFDQKLSKELPISFGEVSVVGRVSGPIQQKFQETGFRQVDSRTREVLGQQTPGVVGDRLGNQQVVNGFGCEAGLRQDLVK